MCVEVPKPKARWTDLPVVKATPTPTESIQMPAHIHDGALDWANQERARDGKGAIYSFPKGLPNSLDNNPLARASGRSVSSEYGHLPGVVRDFLHLFDERAWGWSGVVREA